MTWTRERATHLCNTCFRQVDGDVIEDSWRGRYWQADAHDAQCGAPCAGGVLTDEQRRAGVHPPHDRGRCPGCADVFSRAWANAKRDTEVA